ncbi:hypothetical protein C8R45DRAFT_1065263 [Mycena sanguinolenta]|nr:hypothetical protein C8R45DRAFT_1065263 [Mycena sanguinolenta]
MATLDIDAATAALIAQFTLDDIAEIRDGSKGKAREETPPSDAEWALRAYAEEVEDMRRFIHDLELARSIDAALELDQPVLAVLSVVEEGLREDRVYAQALEQGHPLPPQSELQRLLEDPDFLRLGDDVQDIPGDADGAPNELLHVIHETPTRSHCVICRDDFLAQTLFMAPCNHFYCRQCLSNLATSCIGDESLFPLQCCRRNLPMDGPNGVFSRLDFRLQVSLRKKTVEFGTLFRDRLYCPQPTCSRFLGSTTEHQDKTVCPRCGTEVCVACKEAAHPDKRCGEDLAIQQVEALAREQHWQKCPGCTQLIELQQGCYHMTCRCRTEFCYLCAARWKTCACPQWDEARLLNTAEQRVQNEMGARARVVAPAIFQHHVEQRIERLRYEHDCANGHRWSRRNGRARCEECRFMLPEYLLVCRSCGIAACVRCARNRL